MTGKQVFFRFTYISNAANVLNVAQVHHLRMYQQLCVFIMMNRSVICEAFLQFSSSWEVFYVFLPTIKGQSAATQQILKCSSL